MSELTVEGLRRGPPARSGRWVRLFAATAAGLVVVVFGLRNLPPRHVSFTASSENLQAYDLWEESVRVSAPHAGNPFEGAALRGQFVLKGSNRQWNVDGFCDADERKRLPHPVHASHPGRLQLFDRVPPGMVPEGCDRRHSMCRKRRPPRAHSHRSSKPLAFSVGRHGRALFFQRHDGLLADGLAAMTKSSARASNAFTG